MPCPCSSLPPPWPMALRCQRRQVIASAFALLGAFGGRRTCVAVMADAGLGKGAQFPTMREQESQRPVWEQAIIAIRQEGRWHYYQAKAHAELRRGPRASRLPSGPLLAVTAHNPMADDLSRELTGEENALRNAELVRRARDELDLSGVYAAFSMDADDQSDYAEHGFVFQLGKGRGGNMQRGVELAREFGQAAVYVMESDGGAGTDFVRILPCSSELEGLRSNHLELVEIDEPVQAKTHTRKADEGLESSTLSPSALSRISKFV